MKTVICAISLFLACQVSLHAQQEALVSQFAFNRDLFNPASLPKEKAPRATLLHRNQWSGLNGAPMTQLISYIRPDTLNRSAWGLYLQRHSIGIQERLELAGALGYRLPVKNHDISLGLRISSRRYVLDYTSPEIFAINGIEPDPELLFAKLSSASVNMGFSIHYERAGFYAGIFVDRLLKNMIASGDRQITNEEVRHIYGMAGGSFRLNDSWDYKPQFLFKIAEQTPFNLDFLSMFTYNNNLNIGLNVRSGGAQNAVLSSFNYIMGFQFTDNIFAGLSYDITVSRISDAENGSLELMLSYRFARKANKKPLNALPDNDAIANEPAEPVQEPKPSNETETSNPGIRTVYNWVDTNAILAGKTQTFDKIYYGFNEYSIDVSAAYILDELADFLTRNPDIRIELIAHTDARGAEEYNLELSTKRARSALMYLRSKGVSEDQVIAVGKGESMIRNHCKNDVECTEKEHLFNRRTEVRLTDN